MAGNGNKEIHWFDKWDSFVVGFDIVDFESVWLEEPDTLVREDCIFVAFDSSWIANVVEMHIVA